MKLIAIALVLAACSSSSNGPSADAGCDASECAAIEQQLVMAGGGPSSCVEPTPKFEAACQSLADCNARCGH